MTEKLKTYLILTVVFIVISGLTIYYIFNQFNNGSDYSINIFKLFPKDVLLQLFVLLMFYFLFDTLRFYYILRTLKIKINFIYMIKLAMINIFVSNVTPFATGGGFAQIYFLTKKGVGVGHSTAAASIRTMLPIVFFFFASPLILLFNTDIRRVLPNNLIISILLIIAFFVFVYFSVEVIRDTKLIKRQLYQFFYFLHNKKILSEHLRKRILKTLFIEIDRFAFSVKLYFTGNPIYIISSIISTICFLFILFMFPVILIEGLNNGDLPIVTILEMQVLVTFLTYFAPTPGATGIAEGGFIGMFKHFVSNQLPELTFSWRLFTIYIGLFIGLVFFYHELLKKK